MTLETEIVSSTAVSMSEFGGVVLKELIKDGNLNIYNPCDLIENLDLFQIVFSILSLFRPKYFTLRLEHSFSIKVNFHT